MIWCWNFFFQTWTILRGVHPDHNSAVCQNIIFFVCYKSRLFFIFALCEIWLAGRDILNDERLLKRTQYLSFKAGDQYSFQLFPGSLHWWIRKTINFFPEKQLIDNLIYFSKHSPFSRSSNTIFLSEWYMAASDPVPSPKMYVILLIIRPVQRNVQFFIGYLQMLQMLSYLESF